MSIAGEHLLTHPDPEVFLELLNEATDESNTRRTREIAVLALGRALGEEWHSLPPSSRHFDFIAIPSRRILELARERAYGNT